LYGSERRSRVRKGVRHRCGVSSAIWGSMCFASKTSRRACAPASSMGQSGLLACLRPSATRLQRALMRDARAHRICPRSLPCALPLIFRTTCCSQPRNWPGVKRSVGQVISELARRGFPQSAVNTGTDASLSNGGRLSAFGIHPLPARGAIVTNTLIDRLRDEEGI